MAAVWHETALTAYAHIFPPDAPTPTVEDMARALTGNPGFVFEDGGEIVGTVQVLDGDYLSRLYVLPSHWRRGIARRLHDAAVDMGARHLWVLRRNTIARDMYERWGWQENGRTVMTYAPADIDDVGYSLP
jgi:GNAT superfamily N-acetyltransferase